MVVLGLLRESARELQRKGIEQWLVWLDPDEDKIKWIQEGFENGEFFALESNGHLAGMYRLSFSDLLYWGAQETASGYIHSLIIRPEFAGQRLGETVLNYLEEQLAGEGYPFLRLDCNASNQKLCAYYERQGFKIAGQKQMPHSLNNLYEKPLRTKRDQVRLQDTF